MLVNLIEAQNFLRLGWLIFPWTAKCRKILRLGKNGETFTWRNGRANWPYSEAAKFEVRTIDPHDSEEDTEKKLSILTAFSSFKRKYLEPFKKF